MIDVLMVAVTTAFFALCLAYVRWCDHIIGADPLEPAASDAVADTVEPERSAVPA
jgi:hypothetical protein